MTATHLATGSVLRAQGTPTDAPPVRLVCTTASAHVAVWTDEAVLAAFRSCPWVEDDLRSAADPILALVGMSMGALGRRLDDALRAHVGALLKVRSLLAGEVIAEAGAPVPGLVVVGAGRLELTQQDAVVGELPPGEFLFADQVLAAGSAPFGARAGAGGALVLAGNRAARPRRRPRRAPCGARATPSAPTSPEAWRSRSTFSTPPRRGAWIRPWASTTRTSTPSITSAC